MQKNNYSSLTFIVLFAVFLISPSVQATEDWKRVRLASYPHSGNHWVRALIEEATHIATGSVYRDAEPSHLLNPFPWGGYTMEHGYAGNCRQPDRGDFIVIKTHFPAYKLANFDEYKYLRTIRIVRHPIDSIFSFYLCKLKPGISREKIPLSAVKNGIQRWSLFENYWDQQSDVLTIRYEDLYDRPAANLKLMLNFIGYSYSDADIRRAIEAHPPQGGLLKHRRHYNKQGLRLIAENMQAYLSKYNYEMP